MMTDLMNKEVLLHLQSILQDVRSINPDTKQIEHDVFEIAEHLGIDVNEVTKR